MHISNILKDKLFVFSGSSQPTDAEKEIIGLISEKENLGQIKNITLVSNGESYDSYKVSADRDYLVKASLDKNIKLFSREAEILKLLEGQKIAPQYISEDFIKFGEKIPYLVTTFENLNPAEELGNSILFENYKGILNRLNCLTSISYHTTTKQKIEQIFESTNFNSQPEFADLVKENSDNYSLIYDEIEGLKTWIQENYCESYEKGNLIHSNVSPSSLLLGTRALRVINWQNAFHGNSFFELAVLKFNFDYPQDFEYKVYNYYNSLTPTGSWHDYIQTRNFWSGVILLNLVFSFVKEIFLFRSLRHDKILSYFHSFCRNVGMFDHIPAFQKNREKLAELFSYPMS